MMQRQTELQAELRVQQDTLTAIRRVAQKFEKEPSPNHSFGYFESQSQVMQQYWQSFVEQHKNLIRKIHSMEERQNYKYFASNHYEKV